MGRNYEIRMEFSGRVGFLKIELYNFCGSYLLVLIFAVEVYKFISVQPDDENIIHVSETYVLRRMDSFVCGSYRPPSKRSM